MLLRNSALGIDQNFIVKILRWIDSARCDQIGNSIDQKSLFVSNHHINSRDETNLHGDSLPKRRRYTFFTKYLQRKLSGRLPASIVLGTECLLSKASGMNRSVKVPTSIQKQRERFLTAYPYPEVGAIVKICEKSESCNCLL